MVFALDWCPANTAIFGACHPAPRQDIEDGEDVCVWVHRFVPVPMGMHITGPGCFCSPVWRRRCEVESSAFKYEATTLRGGHH
jgi:hypothetical protein